MRRQRSEGGRPEPDDHLGEGLRESQSPQILVMLHVPDTIRCKETMVSQAEKGPVFQYAPNIWDSDMHTVASFQVLICAMSREMRERSGSIKQSGAATLSRVFIDYLNHGPVMAPTRGKHQ